MAVAQRPDAGRSTEANALAALKKPRLPIEALMPPDKFEKMFRARNENDIVINGIASGKEALKRFIMKAWLIGKAPVSIQMLNSEVQDILAISLNSGGGSFLFIFAEKGKFLSLSGISNEKGEISLTDSARADEIEFEGNMKIFDISWSSSERDALKIRFLRTNTEIIISTERGAMEGIATTDRERLHLCGFGDRLGIDSRIFSYHI